MRRSAWNWIVAVAAIAIGVASSARGDEPIRFELSGYLAAEARIFSSSPAFSAQRSQQGSLAAQPELYWEWNDGNDSVLFTPFLRLDSADPERTHADVRELSWSHFGDDWELRMGIGKVFWGVAESRHLVDIVNQTDLIENIDGEDKLGQPMINLSLIREWGTVDLFVLPGFRERTFPGPKGRLRAAPAVRTDDAEFESGAGGRRIDFAVRWSHAVGDWDLGLSHFYGTNRAPELEPFIDRSGNLALRPRYHVINQTGLDVQATKGNWLWKLEATHRLGEGKPVIAAVGGFEYTIVGVFDSSADLGLLAEYLYDSRRDNSPHPLEDDLFVGARLALNDAASTEVLAGVIQDLDRAATLFNVEASRRIGERWKVELELRLFTDVSSRDPQFFFRDDDHLQLTLSRYF